MTAASMTVIGSGLPDTPWRKVSYFSTENIHEDPIVVWDLVNIGREYQQQSPHSFLDAFLEPRKKQMDELFDLGHNLVIFVPPPLQATFNRRPGGHITVPLSTFVPAELETDSLVGEKIELKTDESALRTFWDFTKGFYRYSAVLVSHPGKAFLFAPGSERKAVGAFERRRAGHLLLLPALSTAGLNRWVDFSNSLLRLFDELEPTEEPIPLWAAAYQSASERALRGTVSAAQKRLSEATEALSFAEASLRDEERLKVLICGTGIALENQVTRALQELGIEAEKDDRTRADALLTYMGKTGLAEVKGRSGSAREEDAAQLEKWTAEWKSDGHGDAKGFLFVSTFNDKALSDRNQQDFPAQMLPYSTARGHCLASGAQLLAMVLEVRAHPEQKDIIAKKLWDSIGVVNGFDDLSSQLTTNALS